MQYCKMGNSDVWVILILVPQVHFDAYTFELLLKGTYKEHDALLQIKK